MIEQKPHLFLHVNFIITVFFQKSKPLFFRFISTFPNFHPKLQHIERLNLMSTISCKIFLSIIVPESISSIPDEYMLQKQHLKDTESLRSDRSENRFLLLLPVSSRYFPLLCKFLSSTVQLQENIQSLWK